MKNKVFVVILCLSIFSLLLLGFVSGKERVKSGGLRSEQGIKGDLYESSSLEIAGRDLSEIELKEKDEKSILIEAREDYKKLRLKEKKKLREKEKKASYEKRQADLEKEKKLQDERNKKRKLRMGESLFDEDAFLKKHGINIKRPKVTVESSALPYKKTVVNFSKGAQISEGKENVVLKKKKDKKKIKLKYEDLVMTEEEEAEYWGYSMEEWKNLPDEEKYGSCDDSKANTEFGGKTMNWDFE